jgi:IS30 family transposase
MKTKDDQLTPQQIDEICALYKLGVAKLTIAKQFSKHHSTIIYHIAKRERLAGGNFIVKRSIPKNRTPSNEPKSTQFIFARVKTYKDYEQEEMDRVLKKRLSCPHTEIVKTFKCRDCGEIHNETVHSDTFWKEHVVH